MNIKHLVRLAVLTAIALVIFTVEMQIPAIVPIPGVKLGLANIITLVTMAVFRRRDAVAVLGMRIVLGAIFTGTLVSFVYSTAGGICCLVAMGAVIRKLPEKYLWAVSVVGALAHNFGQLVAATAFVGTAALWYVPALVISAILTGLFTGIAACLSVGRLKVIFRKEDPQ